MKRVLDLIQRGIGQSVFRERPCRLCATCRAETLQRQFRQYFGKTVFAVLRDRRFERARQELLRAAPAASVSDIAARCGFTHLARFSAEYRRRYHENPSATLRRRADLPDLPRASLNLS